MTIGIEEAQRRNRMNWHCSQRIQYHHRKCSGYYVKTVREWGRELDFCQCECHSTQRAPVTPLRRLKPHPHTNPGVSGEGDS